MRIDKIIRSFDKKVIMKFLKGFLFIFFFFIIPISLVYALLDPAFIYCKELGYKNIVNVTEGGETDYCQFPNGLSVDAWEFLEGKVAQEFSYCKIMGYEIKTVKNSIICQRLLSEECAVCILPNGTEVEVTELMNLSLREGICGDGRCAIGETYFNCPQDCPSGSLDGVCDGVKDGKCDPDCVRLNVPEQDTDCLKSTTTIRTTTTTVPIEKPSRSIYIYVIIIGIFIAIITFFIYKIKVVK
jgi:putative hemolysin